MSLPLKDLQRKTAEAASEGDDRRPSASFRHRLAAQQFLKHNGPIMRVYMKTGGASSEMAHGKTFADRTIAARELALRIASLVLGKPASETTLEDARHFRPEAAEMVAEAWDGNVELNMDKVAKDIASAVAGADRVYDEDTIRWAAISGSGSATLTAANAAFALATAIEIYDFRLGQNLVLQTLASTVIAETMAAVAIMSSPQATAEDKRSLSQTTLRNNCAIMRQIYEQAAREALKTMADLPESEKQDWLRRRKPLETIVQKFSRWSNDIAQVTAMVAREATKDASSEEQNKLSH